MAGKDELRVELARGWPREWGDADASRPPRFPGAGRAAERLRRLSLWRQARVVAVMPDPVLLQVRVNALGDGKTLIAATPGLKDGLVRVTPQDSPVPARSRELGGHALAKVGKVLRFPRARLGRVDLLVGAVLAVDRRGRTLGDGRGLLDLCYALLRLAGEAEPPPALAVLAADEQIAGELPRQTWDVAAEAIVTPTEVIRPDPAPTQPQPGLAGLPPRLASLPVVRGVLTRTVRGGHK